MTGPVTFFAGGNAYGSDQLTSFLISFLVGSHSEPNYWQLSLQRQTMLAIVTFAGRRVSPAAVYAPSLYFLCAILPTVAGGGGYFSARAALLDRTFAFTPACHPPHPFLLTSRARRQATRPVSPHRPLIHIYSEMAAQWGSGVCLACCFSSDVSVWKLIFHLSFLSY